MDNMEWEYIKVRDPKIGESGWAYIRDGEVILDNTFERIPHGSILELEEDGYTIKDFVDSNDLAWERMEREQREEFDRQNRELKKYIGKKVKVRRGIGLITEIKGTRATVVFDEDTKHYNLATILQLEADGKVF